MKRYPGLDLLRAIAILWVMLFHGITEGLGSPWPAAGRLGWMGVDLFFVLSGYLIGSQLLKISAQGQSPAIGSFYVRRAFRILPAYWVVLAFYFFAQRFRESPGIEPVWKFLTFSENFLIDYRHHPAFSHAWSLCVEEHFYVVFPLLAWALLRRSSRKLTAGVCALIFGGGLALRAYVWLCFVNPMLGSQSRPWVELIYYPSYMRLDGLLVGVILASLRWYRPVLWQKAMSNPYKILTTGVVSFSVAIWLANGRTDFIASVFGFPLLSISAGLILIACVSDRCLLGRVRVPGAESVATMTFSVYLSHKMTWHIIQVYWPTLASSGGFQAFGIYAGAAFLVGTLLFLLVERPFLLLRGLLDERRDHQGRAPKTGRVTA